MTRVGLVLVSHSTRLAEGVAELAAQMAPDVAIIPAGGNEGTLGTDFDAVSTALSRAQSGAGVVLLYDLGSAKMVADLAVEMLGDPESAVVVDAPLVEGAVAAAIAAQTGATLDEVLSAAASALTTLPEDTNPLPDEFLDEPFSDEFPGDFPGGLLNDPLSEEKIPPLTHRRDIHLTNAVGLHARPAALLARTLAPLDAEVTITFGPRTANAKSPLELMALGATGGDHITVTATGPDAPEALQRIQALATQNFGD